MAAAAAALPPPPLPPPPPSRQLYVSFPSKRPRDIRDIEDIFVKEEGLKACQLGKNRDYAFVTYWTTEAAFRAKRRFDGDRIYGILLKIDFLRSSSLLRIDDYPVHYARDQVIAVVKQHLPRYAWIDIVPEKRYVFIMMNSIEDAIESVRVQQGRTFGDWRWEIEFHGDREHRPGRNAVFCQFRQPHQCLSMYPPRQQSPQSLLPPPPAVFPAAAAASVPAAAAAAAAACVTDTETNPTSFIESPIPPSSNNNNSSMPKERDKSPPPPSSIPDNEKTRSPSPPRSPLREKKSTRHRSSRSRSRSPRRTRSSTSSRRQRSPSPSLASISSTSRSPSPPVVEKPAAAIHASADLRDRSPPPSPSPSSSPSPRRHRSSHKKSKRGRRSRSSSPERYKSKKRRSSSSRRHSRRSPSVSSSSSRSQSPSASSSEQEDLSEETSSAPDATCTDRFPYSCSECDKYLHHLSRRHTIAEDEVTKKLVTAWFRGTFEFYPDESGKPPSRKSFLTIRRQPFLKEYLNPFLRSAGLQPWTARSPLYTDWFLSDVLRLSIEERNTTRPWRFHRLTSKDAFRDQLKKLLKK